MKIVKKFDRYNTYPCVAHEIALVATDEFKWSNTRRYIHMQEATYLTEPKVIDDKSKICFDLEEGQCEHYASFKLYFLSSLPSSSFTLLLDSLSRAILIVL